MEGKRTQDYGRRRNTELKEGENMFGTKVQKETYDRDELRPVIRSSICTGEKVAGFKELRTGKFTEIMLIRNEEDRKLFLERYDISPSELKTEW
jgi:hypothetical protein